MKLPTNAGRPHAAALLLALSLLLPAVAPAFAAPASARGSAPAPVPLDTKLFKALAARSIGPANMGGRISDIDAVEKKPSTLFLATGTGGLFKTTNSGTTWSPLFDKEAVASIGAVAVWQKNPRVVWAGTGEANSRNSSSWGRGVYRSADGGTSWKLVGLEATSTIARIVPDPSDSNTVYVAALGRLWGENAERGVFKTSDGGKSWQHVLKVDARTGAVDLAMDPSDPRVLYAAMYARRRTPWSYTGVSETGGIWRSTNGGQSWTKLTDGLPKRTGRIGLSVYRKNPRVVYAVLDSDEGGRLSDFEETSRSGGVFRSVDGGDHWKRISAVSPRPFYFSQIRVQPDDSTRVYLLGTDLFVSDDGGVTFRSGGARNLHPDCHAMWIDPANGDHVMMGTDGGLFVSHDRVANWDFLNNLAIGEFYTVTADLREPNYRVYGGLQDNQSWGGPSRTRMEVETWLDEPASKGILNDHWYVLGGGDGFYVQADPRDPDLVYYESQGAYIMRQHLETGVERYLRPSNNEGEPTFRFNWNAPFQISPHDPNVIWLGGNRLFRLYDRGERWEIASPDLTTQDPKRMTTGGSGAEQYCTITTLGESPVRAGTIWAGTDDGRLWVTTTAGGAWSDVTANLKGVPPGLYISRIEPSHHDPNVAYVCIDGHRSDVFAPYLLVTRDLGRSWSSLAAGLPKDAPVKVVREGLENPRLLFVGTEFGLQASLDGGQHWMPLMHGLPTVAVDDLHIHPREKDLLVATHGRSVYVVDGIQAYEQWNERVLSDTVTFFRPRAAWAWQKRPLGAVWGQREFTAKNPPFGAWFDYFLPREVDGGVSIAITDSAGVAVRTVTGPGTPGLSRVTWDLVAGEPRSRIRRGEWGGQPWLVRAGRYKAKLTVSGAKPIEQWFEVKAVPGTYPDEL